MPGKPLRLTSECERGDPDAKDVAFDDEGRDWGYCEVDKDDLIPDADQVVPEWPPCVACGGGVDTVYEPCWWHGMHPEEDLYAHSQCVELLFRGE